MEILNACLLFQSFILLDILIHAHESVAKRRMFQLFHLFEEQSKTLEFQPQFQNFSES